MSQADAQHSEDLPGLSFQSLDAVPPLRSAVNVPPVVTAARCDLIEGLAVETPSPIVGYAADRFDILERAGHLNAVLEAVTKYALVIVRDTVDYSPIVILDETAGLIDTSAEIVGALLNAQMVDHSTPDQIYQWAREGRLPPQVRQDIDRRIEAEFAHEFNTALNEGRSPAQHMRSLLVGRMGYQTVEHRAAAAEQRRQEQARQRVAVRQHEQAEEDWARKVARGIAASPGMSYEEALRDRLPFRADRQRYREIQARLRERSWPGSGYGVRTGASSY
jgi:hypothetical protein